MPDYVFDVLGTTGSPVLLLPGGAAPSLGFFPGIEDALPGHRIICLDRPGTGRAQDLGAATLAAGSAAAAEILAGLDAGPAVVVGQSLGGLQALQFVVDHPELVAGLVLIDPTPVDMPSMMKLTRALLGVFSLPGRVPVVGARLERTTWRVMSDDVDPMAKEAYEVTSSVSFRVTKRALTTTADDAAQLLPRLVRLQVPAALLTADRKPSHAFRQSHVRLAETLGARIVSPPKAVHGEHLRDPQGVNDLIAEVVAEASVRS